MSDVKMLGDLAAVLMALMDNHFIRVDGLKCKPICGGNEYIIPRKPGKNIRWDSNGGLCAVALPDGMVWIRENDGGSTTAHSKVRTAAGNIPVATGCNVPLSNQEIVSPRDIIRRVANPLWIPDYHMTDMAREAGFTQRGANSEQAEMLLEAARDC